LIEDVRNSEGHPKKLKTPGLFAGSCAEPLDWKGEGDAPHNVTTYGEGYV